MRLVKLPEFDEGFVYINPDHVTSLYVENEFTIVLTSGEDYRIPLPMDEVASRLVNGNTIHGIIEGLREDNHEVFASGGVVDWETIKKSDWIKKLD